MTTDTTAKSIIRHVRINIGGDDKATPKVAHPIKWEYAFPCNTEQEAEAFLSFRAYAYAARGELHDRALNGTIMPPLTEQEYELETQANGKDSANALRDARFPYSQADIRRIAIECVTTPDESRGGGNGGGNPALASKAQAFAGLVKSGQLARAVVIPLLATGKATAADAEAALDKAIAKLAA